LKDKPTFFKWLTHEILFAFAFALAKAGSKSPAINATPNRITNNSMSEKARAR